MGCAVLSCPERSSERLVADNAMDLTDTPFSMMPLSYFRQAARPHLVLQLDSFTLDESQKCLIIWLSQFDIQTLNVAAPRESKRPSIYAATLDFLGKYF